MPFLLLDDANKTVLDELQQHVQDLLNPPTSPPPRRSLTQTAPVPLIQPPTSPTAPVTAPLVVPVPQVPTQPAGPQIIPQQQPDPDVMQQLQQHVVDLQSGATQAVEGGALQLGDVKDQLAQHVSDVSNGVINLAAPPTPSATAPSPVAGAPQGDVEQDKPLDKKGVIAYVQQKAAQFGLDPAAVLAVANQEGLNTDPGSNWTLPGEKNISFGPPSWYGNGAGADIIAKHGADAARWSWTPEGIDYWLSQVQGAAKGLTGDDAVAAIVNKFERPREDLAAGEIAKAKQAYNQFVGGVQQAAQTAVQGAQQKLADISQFGDKQLSAAEAYAACGPAAAVRFAQLFGRNPTLREATDLAAQVGWTAASGMAGLASESKLFDVMGIAHRTVGADWQALAREAQSGNPVAISMPGHFFTADGYDPTTGAFHVGRSGLDLKGGSEWMTPEQMQARMGQLQGGLAVDNPTVPGGSPLSQGTSSAAQTVADQGIQIVRNVSDKARQLAQVATQNPVLREAGDLASGGLTRRFDDNLQDLTQNVLGVGQVDASQGITPLTGALASGLESTADTADQLGGGGLVPPELMRAGAGVLRQPGVIDSMRTLEQLATKYGTHDTTQYTPDDQKVAGQAMLTAGGVLAGTDTGAVNTGGVPIAGPQGGQVADTGVGARPDLSVAGENLVDSLTRVVGRPGVSIEPASYAGKPSSSLRNVVFRDTQGQPRGVLQMFLDDTGQPTNLTVAVDPAVQGQGIATGLYDAAKQAGFDVDAASGAGGRTFAGEMLASSRARGERQPFTIPAWDSETGQAQSILPAAGTPGGQVAAPFALGTGAAVGLGALAANKDRLRDFVGNRFNDLGSTLASEGEREEAQTPQWLKDQYRPLDLTQPLGPQLGIDPAGDVRQGLWDVAQGLGEHDIGKAAGGAYQTASGALSGSLGPSGPETRAVASIWDSPAVREFLQGEEGALKLPGGSLDALAQLRADAARQAGQPPPAPPPGSSERLDYLTGRGKWAPPETPTANRLDQALAVGVNGMLGNTNGFFNNAISGLAENVYRPAATALRGELGPAFADVQAQGAAVGDALASAANTFLTGKRASRLGSADYPEAFPGKLGALPFTTGNIRANSAMDEMNRTLAMAGGQAAELARLKAANPGASIQELISQNQQRLQDVGTSAAKVATFEEGGTPLGDALAAARRRLTAPDATPAQRLGGLVTQLVIPFSKIPDVILTRGVLGIPGFAEGRAAVNIARGVRSGDPVAARGAISQLATTEAVNAGLAWQVMQGNITGNGPDDPAKKAALQNARDADGSPIWQANSIRVPTPWGQRWIPYSGLGPVAIRMAAIANAIEQYDDQGSKVSPDLLKATSKAVGETITDAWYLQGVARVFQALKMGGITDAAGNTLLDFGERYVPDSGLAYELRQFVDPTVREPTNPLEDVANRIPGASLLVRPRVNPGTGGPTQAPRDLLSAIVRSSAPGIPDPVNAALAQHNIGIGQPPSTVSEKGHTISITPDEQYRYSQVAGTRVADRVHALTNGPRWASLTQDQQRVELQRAVDTARSDAAIEIMRSVPPEEEHRREDAYRAAQSRQSEPQFRSPSTVP